MQISNKKKYIIISIAIILIAGGLFFIFRNLVGNNVPVDSMEGVSITTIVKEETYKETITASGTVHLENEVSIYSSEEGLVIKNLLVNVGDVVEEGQVIAEYDIEDKKDKLETTISTLERSLETEKLNLKNLLLTASESEKINLENSVLQAEKALLEAQTNLANFDSNLEQKEQAVRDALVSLENAQKTYEQNIILYEIGGVTESALNDSENAVQKAQVSYNNAVTELDEFRKSKTSLELSVKSAETTLKQNQLNLANADNPLSTEAAKINYQKQLNTISSIETDLAKNRKELAELPYYAYSTTSGTVTYKVDEGSKTVNNAAIVKVANLDQLIVKASISEYDVPNIAVGQQVEMTSEGIEGVTYYGTITKIDTSATSKTTNLGSETVVGVEISIENTDGTLKPGYTLDLEIIVESRENTISVNSKSILTDEETGLSYVFLVQDGKIYKTQVELGKKTSVKTQVLSGLKDGDEIVTTAFNELTDGMTIDEVLVALTMPMDNNMPEGTFEGNYENKTDSIDGGEDGGQASDSSRTIEE